MGDARYFLGLEIARSASGLYVAQTKYAMDIIKETGLDQAKSASSPFPSGLKLAASSGPILPRPDSYRRLHCHVVRYLKGSPSKGLYFLTSNSLALRAFCDADWACCPDSRHSLTEYCVYLGDVFVSWKTKK
ncbi:UNVERIFIED_CONTAM: hypothetical protein Sindi_2658600 [Sesamum indicum]